jgi:hypothetical protein
MGLSHYYHAAKLETEYLYRLGASKPSNPQVELIIANHNSKR